MKCNRCTGLLLKDYSIEMEESLEQRWLCAWRCANCGHTVDPVMAANRQRQALLHVRREEIALETLTAVIPPLAVG